MEPVVSSASAKKMVEPSALPRPISLERLRMSGEIPQYPGLIKCVVGLLLRQVLVSDCRKECMSALAINRLVSKDALVSGLECSGPRVKGERS